MISCWWPIQFAALRHVLKMSLVVLLVTSVVDGEENSPIDLQRFSEQQESFSSSAPSRLASIAVIVQTTTERTIEEEWNAFLAEESLLLPSRLGMGVIIDVAAERTLILTPANLVEPMIRRLPASPDFRLLVQFHHRQVKLARIVAADPRCGLAMLEAEGASEHLEAAATIVNEPLQQGEVVIAAGNALRFSETGQPDVTWGVVAHAQVSLPGRITSDGAEKSLLQLNSLCEVDFPRQLNGLGTALFNLEGNLAGLVVGQGIPDGTNRAMPYVFPLSSKTQRIIQELATGHEAEYGFLGVSTETTRIDQPSVNLAGIQQFSAALVLRVPDGSPARKSGIARGDMILKVGDEIIESTEDLIREVNFIAPGEEVEIELLRDGEVKTVPVRLAKWPIADDRYLVVTQHRHPPWRGLRVDHATGRNRYLPDQFLTEFPRGVVVADLEPESSASRAGLQVGQLIVKVNGQQVNTPAEFHKHVAEVRQEVKFTLGDGGLITLPLE